MFTFAILFQAIVAYILHNDKCRPTLPTILFTLDVIITPLISDVFRGTPREMLQQSAICEIEFDYNK